MSRRDQDIPIRPRYGISDMEDNNSNDTETEMKDATVQQLPATPIKIRKTSASAEKMTSSYSEIPFLARYPDPSSVEKEQQQQTDITPTIVTKDLPGNRGSFIADDDSIGDEEENSKSSSCEASKTPKRPASLHCDSSFPYELEGATSVDGQMRHFVAENLEEQLRSPVNKKDQFGFATNTSTPSNSTTGMLTRHFLQTQMPQIDANVLSDIEIEAQYLAASVDNLTENLCNLLHSISSITADNVEVHKDAVNKLTDSMDANIKCMYTIMAKTEEITKSMKPTEQLGQRIREIKRLVDMLDNTM